MSEVNTDDAVGGTATISRSRPSPASGSANGKSNGKTQSRHELEFERPLATLEQQIREIEALQAAKGVDYSKELRQLRNNYTSLLRKIYDNLSAWDTVRVARHPQRPLFNDYVELICREFRELHGDRNFGDDPAIKCGLARIGTYKVM